MKDRVRKDQWVAPTRKGNKEGKTYDAAEKIKREHSKSVFAVAVQLPTHSRRGGCRNVPHFFVV